MLFVSEIYYKIPIFSQNLLSHTLMSLSHFYYKGKGAMALQYNHTILIY